MTTIQPTMMIINSNWNDIPSFKLIPVSIECPYAECIFDTDSKTLVVIMKNPSQALRMVPKLDANGDIEAMKNGQPRPGGKKYKEERKTLELSPEILVSTKSDIENLIHLVAINSTTFDYEKFFVVVPPIANKPPTVIEEAKVILE